MINVYLEQTPKVFMYRDNGHNQNLIVIYHYTELITVNPTDTYVARNLIHFHYLVLKGLISVYMMLLVLHARTVKEFARLQGFE